MLNGKPMALGVAAVFQAAGLSVSLVVRDEKLRDLGLPLIVEPPSEGHYPLRGVLAGLGTLEQCESALFCPCDLPYLTPESVQRLVEAPAPAVAFDGERPHPLFVHLARSSWGALRDHIERQDSATAFVTLAHRVGVPMRELRNINRQEDLLMV